MTRFIRCISLFVLLGSLCECARAQVSTSTQVAPDCQFPINVTAVTGVIVNVPAAGYDNRFIGCQYWMVEYTTVAVGGSITGISLQNGITPLLLTDWSGTVVTGINPNTALYATSTYSTGCVSGSACTTPNAYIRLKINPNLNGTITGVVYGWKSNPSSIGGSGGGSSGCVGTQTTPCITQIFCPNNVNVGLSGSGLTQILAASGTKKITVCHISAGFASGVNFQLEYGTGTNCGTGTTAVTGVYQTIQGIALDTPFTLPASQALCVNLGSAVAGGGILVYAQQ